MPTRKKQRIPLERRKAVNSSVKSAAEVIAYNLAGRKIGRPPMYHSGFCHIAEQCCIINADSPELGDMFGCRGEAISEWMEKYPHFAQAIKAGKAKTDAGVERSLVHRANGYSHKESIFMSVSGPRGEGSSIEEIKTIKHYPPDTRAAEFWLKNRKPKDYRADPELANDEDVPPPVSVTIEFKDARRKKE